MREGETVVKKLLFINLYRVRKIQRIKMKVRNRAVLLGDISGLICYLMMYFDLSFLIVVKDFHLNICKVVLEFNSTRPTVQLKALSRVEIMKSTLEHSFMVKS